MRTTDVLQKWEDNNQNMLYRRFNHRFATASPRLPNNRKDTRNISHTHYRGAEEREREHQRLLKEEGRKRPSFLHPVYCSSFVLHRLKNVKRVPKRREWRRSKRQRKHHPFRSEKKMKPLPCLLRLTPSNLRLLTEIAASP